jgi:hypothetical protein
MKCANCEHALVDHCRIHLIPCCPGKCPSEKLRPFAVFCPSTFSCGWTGERRARSLRAAQEKPCPNCGGHVRASGGRPSSGNLAKPGLSATRFHLL